MLLKMVEGKFIIKKSLSAFEGNQGYRFVWGITLLAIIINFPTREGNLDCVQISTL